MEYAYNDGVSSNDVAITVPSDPYITWAAETNDVATDDEEVLIPASGFRLFARLLAQLP